MEQSAKWEAKSAGCQTLHLRIRKTKTGMRLDCLSLRTNRVRSVFRNARHSLSWFSKSPKIPAGLPKGPGGRLGVHVPPSSEISNFPGLDVAPVNGIKSPVRLSERIEPMSRSAAKHGKAALPSARTTRKTTQSADALPVLSPIAKALASCELARASCRSLRACY